MSAKAWPQADRPADAAADQRIQTALRADVRARAAYVVQDARGLIKLDAMENPYGLPENLRVELAKRLSQLALNRYPDARADALRQAIAAANGQPNADHVLLGNGSDELISLLVAACASPSACVLSVAPSFVMFRLSAELARVPFIEVPLRADFSLPLDAMLAAIEKHQPPLIFIAYPNNPTGTLFERAAIEAIIQASTGLVVIDEAYAAFSPDSFVDALPAHPHLLVMRTLSKLGLAGIRLGYLLGAPQLLAQIDKVRPPYNVNVLTQCCAQFVFDHMSVFKAQTEALLAAREQLAQALAMRPGLTVFASHANFLLFRLHSADLGAASRVDSALRARGVLIKNVSSSHPLLSNGLRVTVSTPQENAAFLSALDAIWPAARSA